MTEPTGIGAELRRARESQGLAVSDVAQQLKFAPRQIESLENERFDRLPGPTIARGMVRNYARLLNLEPEPLLGRMSPAAEASGLAGLNEPVPSSDSGRRSTAAYAGFSLAVLALVGVVAYFWQHDASAPRFLVTAQPQQPPQPEPAQPEPAPVAAAPAASEPPKAAEKAKAVERRAPQAAAAKPKPEAPAAVQAQAAALTDAPPRVATGNFRRIVLRCEEESWLEVIDGTGRSLVSSLNPPGSERVVRGRGPFEIVIGNAQGVTLLVDDKPVDLKPHTRADVARVAIE